MTLDDCGTDVDLLKRFARGCYDRYQKELDRLDPDCGANMVAVLSPDLCIKARGYNEAMKRLKLLDKNCPDYTPLPEGK